MEIRIAIHQYLFMRDDLRNFDGKDEMFRSSGCPVGNGARGRARIECRVHLDGVEAFCVKGDVVGRSHALRVEGALPEGYTATLVAATLAISRSSLYYRKRPRVWPTWRRTYL